MTCITCSHGKPVSVTCRLCVEEGLAKVPDKKPAKPPKQHKCAVKSCRALFVKNRPMQKVCSPECSHILAVQKRKAAEDKQERARRKETREKLQEMKGRRDYLKEAQAAWNSYVRMRDYGKPCASCGAMPEQKYGGTMDCSHYRSVGAAPHLRFHLHNAAAACVRCNRHLAGNIAALRVGMIERFGLAKVEAIETNNGVRRFDIEYLKRVKRIFTKKAKRLKEKNDGA